MFFTFTNTARAAMNLLVLMLPGAAAWRAGAPQPRGGVLAAVRRRAVPLLCDDLYSSLRARQQTLEDELSERWRKAKCASKVPVALTESWVRRVAVSWPQVAMGTADGSVVLADLSTGEELSRGRGPHPARVEGPESARDMRLLHGDYDGGGLTAIAFTAEHVVSAGREGGCVLWWDQTLTLTLTLTRTRSRTLTLTLTLRTYPYLSPSLTLVPTLTPTLTLALTLTVSPALTLTLALTLTQTLNPSPNLGKVRRC